MAKDFECFNDHLNKHMKSWGIKNNLAKWVRDRHADDVIEMMADDWLIEKMDERLRQEGSRVDCGDHNKTMSRLPGVRLRVAKYRCDLKMAHDALTESIATIGHLHSEHRGEHLPPLYADKLMEEFHGDIAKCLEQLAEDMFLCEINADRNRPNGVYRYNYWGDGLLDCKLTMFELVAAALLHWAKQDAEKIQLSVCSE